MHCLYVQCIMHVFKIPYMHMYVCVLLYARL